MKLSTLLKLQLAYAVAGVGYNIISFVAVSGGGQQFSTTPPLRGGLVMALYGVFLLAAYFDHFKLYRFLMAGSIVGFGYGGIVIHLMNYNQDPGMYVSFLAWFLAVGINVYGLGLNALAVSGRFSIDERLTQ